VGENGPIIWPKLRFFTPFRDLLHVANLRHGANGFTSLPKEEMLKIHPKNPTASAGKEGYKYINPLTPELNPSAQRCLTRFFTGDFAS
jgi:hypothetical protein